MTDELTKIVVDCSLEPQPSAGFTDALRQDALDLIQAATAQAQIDGDQSRIAKATQAAANIFAEAGRLDQLDDPVTIRPMTADEIAEHTAAQADAQAWQDQQDTVQADRAALADKLAAGTATPDEIQTALAQLLT